MSSNLMKELQELYIHTLIIKTSRVDTKEALSIEASQSINYQNASYKQYGDDADAMIEEIIRRANAFKKITEGGFSTKGD